jgi:tetratricopeptide (TPR) repeat protein
VSTALLVEYYQQLPARRPKEDAEQWKVRQQAGQEAFTQQVRARYNEGTLLRLLNSPDLRARRAALYTLGLVGTLEANAGLAACLHEDDADLRQAAVDALWAVWFRADGEDAERELKRLTSLRDRTKALAGVDRLIQRAPNFAEAYNQRAILYFRAKQFDNAAADCEKALELNPHHFGAQAGLGQCLLQMRKHRAALKAFRAAVRLHPYLDGVADAIRKLEKALGDDKK